MDEPQQNPDGRPRKVRFRISSACSGRVLKQVYEDGQALEPPAVEQSRRLRHSFEPGVPPDGPALGLPQSSDCGEEGRGPGCPPAGSGLYGVSGAGLGPGAFGAGGDVAPGTARGASFGVANFVSSVLNVCPYGLVS